MNVYWIILTGLAYLALLFVIASYAQKRGALQTGLLNNGVVYALSMGVYCTAWTYFGSVGRAATNGIDFITIYLGPTIMAGFFWPVLRKILRISKVLRLTSIADFISTRYGKNFSLGIIVALFCVIGMIPYISLQLKAIVDSIDVMQQGASGSTYSKTVVAIGATVVLFLFTILYGARSVDATERHPGLVAVIAFESIIKLVAFLAVGIFITYGLFDGFGDLFAKAASLEHLFALNESSSYTGWFLMMIVSALAIIFLPRQFQVNVVENQQERHLKKASWLFPLYLFLINLFVLPIAFAGILLLGNNQVNADDYVLALPLSQQQHGLALFTWIGGISAATGMIVMETIALSIMVSNNLLMPLLFTRNIGQHGSGDWQKKILLIRRLSVGLVLLLSLLYLRFLGTGQSLVSIGLISFCAVAQFAPAMIGGIFWKAGSRKGAIAGIITGCCIWFYTLIVPNLVQIGALPQSLITEGPMGLTWLVPTHLFQLAGLDQVSHSIFWSLLLNSFVYVAVSLYSNRQPQEIYHAELFVDIFRHSTLQEGSIVWKGTVYMKDLKKLLTRFIGAERSHNLLTSYSNRHRIPIDDEQTADGRMVSFAERILGGVVGQASARIIIQNMAKEEEVSIDEVLHILRENQQMIEMNKELRKKSLELSKATAQLKHLNEQLKASYEQKDEFLYTVTHELRTPLTSIRALSEILYDNPDIAPAQRQQYLDAVITETERLSHLITQVLNLEKYESGRQRLHIEAIDLGQLIREVAASLQPLIQSKQLVLQLQLTDSMLLVPCDKELIRQVLTNLLGNASKFAQHQIRIHAHFNEDEWQIWISDDGKGIEPGLHELIFDKFFQARNQTLRKPEGTGLGLAISKNIIEMHGGTIRVESEPGKGAHFIFTLPVEQHAAIQ